MIRSHPGAVPEKPMQQNGGHYLWQYACPLFSLSTEMGEDQVSDQGQTVTAKKVGA